MDVIYALIPSMIFIGLVLVALLFWSIKSGQFEDFEGDAHRILMDEDLTPENNASENNAPENNAPENSSSKNNKQHENSN